MKNIDFIYNNLEFILPLPVNIFSEPTQMTNPTYNMITDCSSNNKLLGNDCLKKTSQIKEAKQTKHLRNMVLLDDSDLFESELNYSGFITLPSDMPSSEEKDRLKSATDDTKIQSNEKPTKAKSSALTLQCLNSLSEFVDNMSHLDCCLNSKMMAAKQSCRYEEFMWTKGKIKNGLSDELSVEYNDWWSSQSSSELKATAEALSFNKCSKNISKTMESCVDELEGFSLHISRETANLYFGHSAAYSR